METTELFKNLRFDEQFLTFFACLNVFLQNDSTLDFREKMFMLRLAKSMGFDWMDASSVDLLAEKKAQSIYHARLLDMTPRERDHLLRAVIAVITADRLKTSEETAHLQELIAYLGLQKWDMKEMGERIKTIQVSDIDLNDFAPANQILAYLAVLEIVHSDRRLNEAETNHIQEMFRGFSIDRYSKEHRRTGLTFLVERILFGRGLCELNMASLQTLSQQLSAGMSENEIAHMLCGLFGYHAVIRAEFEAVLLDRIDEVAEVLGLSPELSTAIMDFMGVMIVAKKGDKRTSPLFTAMKICLTSKGSSTDRQELWGFLDQKFGFGQLPLQVRNEALAVVLSALALDRVSHKGEELVLDEVIELFGCDVGFANRLVSDFNQSHGTHIVLPDKMNMKEMKSEVRRKNLDYEISERPKKIQTFQENWEKYLKSRSS